ncbi:odorant receptor 2a-like [Epargyreus clarus]|uniref:odorant receptor 2a-like n=1 Tax=Epargyreus clarus TaxID=520877 RepID=UPI003C2FA1CE
MAKLSRVMFLLLCHITSLAKQIVFHTDAKRIDVMIRGLDDAALNPASSRARRLLARTARRARLLLRGYAGCAVLTCTLWIVFPVATRASGRHVEFPFWTGLDTHPPTIFSLVLLYSYYVTTLVGIANTTMDAFVATILYQCKTQLEILRMNLENIIERTRDEVKETGEDEEKVFMRLFVQCLQHYDKVHQTAKLLQDIFGIPILIQFGIGGWILCMAAYKLVSLNVVSIEFTSMTLFILCILTELFLYCYYGNELTVESEQIAGAAYAARWAGAGVRVRRSLLLLMVRARRPLRPAAGLVVALSLDTFLKIIKSSYTFYAVLRQTK